MKHYALRINGYVDFYKKTQLHHRLPFYVVSLWVASIGLLQTLMQHLYNENFTKRCLEGTFFSPIGYICIAVTIEFCVVADVDINYILRVAKFNRQKPPPDVQKEEWNACSSVDSFAHGEIGYRRRGDKFYDFIEKQGATFFSESQNMDDREYLEPILESYGVFKPLRTISVASLHLLGTLALLITAIVYTVLHPDENRKCREYFILIYIQLGLWLFTLIVDQVLRMKHYALRMNGYLDFYKKTQLHHRLPFYVVSLWVASIGLLQTLMQHLYNENFTKKCLEGTFFSPIGYICIAVTIEFCLVAGIDINYILRVAKFNRQEPPPDVQKEEWNACSYIDSFARGEIGYRRRGDKFYDFIEKQADLIRHLKDHNAKLGEKLMILNAQMQSRGRSGTSNA